MTAWTTPRTWIDTPGSEDVLSAALLNTHVRDNELHLHEQRIRSATGVTKLKIDYGSYIVTGANLASGAVDQHAVTFAQNFAAGTIIVQATCVHADDASAVPMPYFISIGVDAIAVGSCNILALNRHGSELRDVTIGWLAIGPVA